MATFSLGAKTGNPVVLPNVQYLGTLTTVAQVPTVNLGVISGISVECDRWGRYLKVVGKFVLGTTASTTASMSLPFSLTSGTSASVQIIGKWSRNVSTASTRKTSDLFIANGSSTINFGNEDNTVAISPSTALNGDQIGVSGDTIFFEYELPITSYALDAWIAYGAGAASQTVSGLVTPSAQVFGGEKTFNAASNTTSTGISSTNSDSTAGATAQSYVAATGGTLVAGAMRAKLGGTFQIGSMTNHVVDFISFGSLVNGGYTVAGTWTLGSTAVNANTHLIQNNGQAHTLKIANLRGNTDTDASAPIITQKGSPTTTAGANYFMRFTISDGTVSSGIIASNGANQAAFFATSDRRAKENIQSLENALTLVEKLNPVTFKWKGIDETSTGFIAQEVYEVLPKVVGRSDDGLGENLKPDQEPWRMTETGFIPYLVRAIQELSAKVALLESK